MNFKVGDKATAFGVMGTIVSIDLRNKWPFRWKSDCGEYEDSFTLEGKDQPWNLIPSLIFVSRPKAMVKKSKQMWVNVYKEDTCSYLLHETQREAQLSANSRFLIACVPVTVEWEEEV